MANIASAQKRILVTTKKQLANQILTSKVKTSLKKFELAVKAQDVALATQLFPAAVSLIDSITHKGVWHKNKADRKKSALALKLQALKNQPAESAAE